ncbi:MAG: glutathione-regulated potassium-efflux system protein KefB [Rhodospirillaceae bacterium]|nr:MAG: glutathione-regulated potassium-efflux system protein KefB [Rhodospirillaceae bacterium]
MEMLAQAAIFLGAAVALVPIFKRLGLGAIIGYLVAGALIGPAGLRLITDVDAISQFAEFGVVLLLFVIGLELQPRRLWTMRASVFGLGGAQVLITAGVLGVGAIMAGQGLASAAVIGLALALSSTAFVLQTLSERGQLATRHGRAAFAILLFQDLAAIPILAVVPFLDGGAANLSPLPALLSLLKVVGVLAGVMIIGPYVLRPALRIMAHTRVRELFTAITLLIVTGTALVMNMIGISMALGAFMAGVLLANSEFRHELEADIDPFKGLFLGLFFISVGMGLDLELLLRHPFVIAGLVTGLLLIKGIVTYIVGRLGRLDRASAKNLGAAIPQGGEFAFVIFAAALRVGVLDQDLAELLTLVVSLSMAATPFVAMVNDALTRRFVRPKEATYDILPDDENPVIIAGFGRVGHIIGRVLAARRIRFTALDINPEQVEFLKRFGNKVYYGDASRLDLLRAAHADKAKVFVLAIDDVDASLRAAETVTRHFPNLAVYARARNRNHAYRLMDLGVTLLQRETFLSALDMAHSVLMGLGLSRATAGHTVRTFQGLDEKRLFEHYTHRNDMEKLQTLAKAASKELEEMFARDAGEQMAAE